MVEMKSLKSKKDKSMQILNSQNMSSMLPQKLQKMCERGVVVVEAVVATMVLAIFVRCFSDIFLLAAPVPAMS
jgi:hypothetical protein